jgi:hypothetical protein
MSINGVVALPPATPSAMPPFGVSEIRKRTNALQEVMRGVMKEGTHFGTIPGTPKPSLWKAGAEVLCMTFRLAPMLDSRVVVDDLDSEWSYSATKRDGSIVHGTSIGFFEVEATCTIHGPQGDVLSRCSARCNNREAKYRALSLFEIRNTILKMSEKRAFVSAVLMATGASDIFTQDLEDVPELVEPQVPPKLSRPGPTTQAALSPRREAWLLRAAQEAKLPEDAVERCLAYLRSSESKAVRTFFDDLSRRKPVFQPFCPKAG